MPRGQRTEYCRREDELIVRYLTKVKGWKLTSGNKIWQTMVDKNVVPGRSFQSLRNRFLKTLRFQLTTSFKHITEANPRERSDILQCAGQPKTAVNVARVKPSTSKAAATEDSNGEEPETVAPAPAPPSPDDPRDDPGYDISRNRRRVIEMEWVTTRGRIEEPHDVTTNPFFEDSDDDEPVRPRRNRVLDSPPDQDETVPNQAKTATTRSKQKKKIFNDEVCISEVDEASPGTKFKSQLAADPKPGPLAKKTPPSTKKMTQPGDKSGLTSPQATSTQITPPTPAGITSQAREKPCPLSKKTPPHATTSRPGEKTCSVSIETLPQEMLVPPVSSTGKMSQPGEKSTSQSGIKSPLATSTQIPSGKTSQLGQKSKSPTSIQTWLAASTSPLATQTTPPTPSGITSQPCKNPKRPCPMSQKTLSTRTILPPTTWLSKKVPKTPPCSIVLSRLPKEIIRGLVQSDSEDEGDSMELTENFFKIAKGTQVTPSLEIRSDPFENKITPAKATQVTPGLKIRSDPVETRALPGEIDTERMQVEENSHKSPNLLSEPLKNQNAESVLSEIRDSQPMETHDSGNTLPPCIVNASRIPEKHSPPVIALKNQNAELVLPDSQPKETHESENTLLPCVVNVSKIPEQISPPVIALKNQNAELVLSDSQPMEAHEFETQCSLLPSGGIPAATVVAPNLNQKTVEDVAVLTGLKDGSPSTVEECKKKAHESEDTQCQLPPSGGIPRIPVATVVAHNLNQKALEEITAPTGLKDVAPSTVQELEHTYCLLPPSKLNVSRIPVAKVLGQNSNLKTTEKEAVEDNNLDAAVCKDSVNHSQRDRNVQDGAPATDNREFDSSTESSEMDENLQDGTPSAVVADNRELFSTESSEMFYSAPEKMDVDSDGCSPDRGSAGSPDPAPSVQPVVRIQPNARWTVRKRKLVPSVLQLRGAMRKITQLQRECRALRKRNRRVLNFVAAVFKSSDPRRTSKDAQKIIQALSAGTCTDDSLLANMLKSFDEAQRESLLKKLKQNNH